ncbi:hypothetical protein ScPMuIL_002612 [Solemya velum]
MEMLGVVFFVMLMCAEAAVPQDLITHLPGLKVMPEWKQYSGYLQANGTKNLHYWLVESAGNVATDPLVLWLNGGPGCSSMLGLLTETGPYKVTEDGKNLMENQYSWNKVASVLYLDSPAGTGFSYSEDRNYTTDDDLVALENLAALRDFFNKYPEFKNNDFYLAGESYAGIYIPTLAMELLGLEEPLGKFVGISVGNGQSSFELTTDATVFFSYFHGLIGDALWRNLTDSCCHGDTTNCKFYTNMADPVCEPVMSKFYSEVYGSGINFCNIYSPRPAGSMPGPVILTPGGPVSVLLFGGLVAVSPCEDYTNLYIYLNENATREALHIPTEVDTWLPCSDEVANDYTTLYTSMAYQYRDLLAAQKKILVYNGDVDLVCGSSSGEWFVDSLNQKLFGGRTAWHYIATDGSQQIAGYLKEYRNMVFATVKGAGHMAPSDKPKEALILFGSFLRNEIPG